MGRHGLLATLLLAPLAGCVLLFHDLAVEPVPVSGEPVTVSSPVKAHLLDGSTVVYRAGVSVESGTLRGAGTRFDLRLREIGAAATVPLDSVLAMESFRTSTNAGTSALASLGLTAALLFGSAGLAVAIFGSCPTVYAVDGETYALEAEAFSYSIAPTFEARDVDRIGAMPDAKDVVELEIRNEALETHYINHVELLEVEHEADETVLPDGNGRPVVVSDVVLPPRVTDRGGRDLGEVLARSDSAVFSSEPERLRDATEHDFEDHIEMVLPAPATDSVAVVLRMRNSLLNTVLFYEGMLAAAGARSLDWLGRDLARLDHAAALVQWYTTRMGLRVEVHDGKAYRLVSRVPDAGPIAWKEVAALIPVPPTDSLRVRLSFVADNWRIDRLAVGTRVRRPLVQFTAPNQLLEADGAANSRALADLSAADERYVQTGPGQRFRVRFETLPAPVHSRRTFLLAARGYYVEWVRGEWIRTAGAAPPFQPSDGALVAALHRWRSVQADFEERFEASRIPVR